jgi:hypothetical protein
MNGQPKIQNEYGKYLIKRNHQRFTTFVDIEQQRKTSSDKSVEIETPDML